VRQGCQIFLGTNYQNGIYIYQLTIKYAKCLQKIPNGRKIYQMAVKYTKWPLNLPTSSIEKPYKIYPNRDFWFEKIPSGNPGVRTKKQT
jgi:hypothetical protein